MVHRDGLNVSRLPHNVSLWRILRRVRGCDCRPRREAELPRVPQPTILPTSQEFFSRPARNTLPLCLLAFIAVGTCRRVRKSPPNKMLGFRSQSDFSTYFTAADSRQSGTEELETEEMGGGVCGIRTFTVAEAVLATPLALIAFTS